MDKQVVKDIKFDDGPCHDIKCTKCGKELRLWYNGGELDTKFCCGMRYELVHGRIDLEIYPE